MCDVVYERPLKIEPKKQKEESSTQTLISFWSTAKLGIAVNHVSGQKKLSYFQNKRYFFKLLSTYYFF